MGTAKAGRYYQCHHDQLWCFLRVTEQARAPGTDGGSWPEAVPAGGAAGAVAAEPALRHAQHPGAGLPAHDGAGAQLGLRTPGAPAGRQDSR